MADENGSTISGNGNQGPNGNGKSEIGNIFGDGTPIIAPGEAVGSPETGTGNTGTQSGKRGRGRPKGSKNGSASAGKTDALGVDIDGLEKLLISTHLGIATLTKIDEFEIAQAEAKLMASAVARVSRHYPSLQRINASAMDHINLATVMAGIYGTRFMAYKIRMAAERDARKRPAAQVHPFPGPHGQAS